MFYLQMKVKGYLNQYKNDYFVWFLIYNYFLKYIIIINQILYF